MSATLQLVPAFAPEPADWTDGALCAQSDPAAWYPPKGDTEAEDAAKAICRRCPLFFQCYAGALARDEQWGIWGGVNFTPADALADSDTLLDSGGCDDGHILDEANTYVHPTGRVECRICKRHNANERKRREREAPGAECANRHVRTPENTYEDARGHLCCWDCVADRAAERAKAKEAAA